MVSNPVIQFQRLSKRFRNNTVLHDLSFAVYPGQIVGLVGPNSAGKTTLLKHIFGMLLPTKGQCKVFGTPAQSLSSQQLSSIGFVQQESELMPWMRGTEIIAYVAAHYPNWNHDLCQHLVTLFELDLHQKIKILSPGQRQKLSILLAVSSEPSVLILDEPCAALDPLARQHFLELLLDQLQDGQRTIVISSHILSDIEKVIDHLLMVDRGILLKNCSLDELREDYTKLELTCLAGELPADLPFKQVFAYERFGNRAILKLRRFDLTLGDISNRLNCEVVEHPLSLEEIYPLVLSESQPIHAH